MALVEGCKHSLEVTVAREEVASETERIVQRLQRQVRLPGFRPGKAPASLIRSRFQGEIRQDVLEALLPKAFNRLVREQNLRVVGTPDVTDVTFDEGQPLTFKAEFEVAPDVALTEYRGLEVPYDEPQAGDEDVARRLEQVREQKADYVNEDPRPLADGDFALVTLAALPDGKPEEVRLQIGAEETLAAFTEGLRGRSPGDEVEIEVTYPDDYGSESLAGKTRRFRGEVNTVQRKELPELNDEFAQDLGDFQTMDEVRDAIRRAILAELTQAAQQEAKGSLLDALSDRHEFPVPEAYIDQQIKSQLESRLRTLSEQGIDPRKLNLDWNRIKEAQRDRATKDVKGALVLEAIADKESIQATQEEVDREVQRLARQDREPVAAVRMRLEKDGTLDRIKYHIRTEKTLQFLFNEARKVPKPAEAPAEVPTEVPAEG